MDACGASRTGLGFHQLRTQDACTHASKQCQQPDQLKGCACTLLRQVQHKQALSMLSLNAILLLGGPDTDLIRRDRVPPSCSAQTGSRVV